MKTTLILAILVFDPLMTPMHGDKYSILLNGFSVYNKVYTKLKNNSVCIPYIIKYKLS